jgi:hypothetical protein
MELATIKIRIKQELKNNFINKGYWKQSLAMRYSYKLGSLKMAWALIKEQEVVLAAIREENSKNSVNLDDFCNSMIPVMESIHNTKQIA